MVRIPNPPSIEVFPGTSNRLQAKWQWGGIPLDTFDHFEVCWWAGPPGDGGKRGSLLNQTTTKFERDDYTISDIDVYNRVTVQILPVSKTYFANDTEVNYWNGEWVQNTFWTENLPPTKPPAPSVSVDDRLILLANLDNLTGTGTAIHYEIYLNDTELVYNSYTTIKTGSARCTWNVAPGRYKIRCRSLKLTPECLGQYRTDADVIAFSEWSDWSSAIETIPPTPSLNDVVCVSETSARFSFSLPSSYTGSNTFEIIYATDLSDPDMLLSSNLSTTVGSITTNTYTLTGLSAGHTYYAKVRATNSAGSSSWSSETRIFILGTTPTAPTTWSSTTTCAIGEAVTLHWVHNSEDESTQRSAEVELIINGVTQTQTINTASQEDDEKTMFYDLDTSSYSDGATILWRVRTAGVTNTYGDWSIQRTIKIYAHPSIALGITDNSGVSITTLTSFPINISCETAPSTQIPIGFYVSITNDGPGYEDVDFYGNSKYVNEGAEVYSKYFDSNTLSTVISAGDIRLSNNKNYKISVTATMDSGLKAENERSIYVEWSSTNNYFITASIGVNKNSLETYIRPTCTNNGELVSGVTMAVYRRGLSGGLTYISGGLASSEEYHVVDPHPALDFARYRIVAVDDETGEVYYEDVPDYPVGEKAVVIQWAEQWSDFHTDFSERLMVQPWTGSMLKLPYNIDVSDNTDPDVSLVEYIGRQHPVSYYGTQLGETATWTVEIPKYDKETLYAIRRLSKWMGDVYVREPSGTGYWANVTVSFSQKHVALTIPITFNIKRVEGGV